MPGRGGAAAARPGARVASGGAHLRLHAPASPGSRDAAIGVAELVERAQAAERTAAHAEARALYERALRHPGLARAGLTVTPAALLRWIARTLNAEGQREAAEEVLALSREVAIAVADTAAVGHADNVQAAMCFQRGELDEADRLWHRALDAAEHGADARLAAMTAGNLGVLANIRGDLEVALRHYRAALVNYRALGMARDVCLALNNLGMLHADLQQWEEAAARYDEGLGIARVLGDRETLLLLEGNLAELHVARGDLAAARASVARGERLLVGLPDEAGAELARVAGIVAREAGDVAGALALLQRALAHARTSVNLLLQAETSRELAELFRRESRNAEMLQSLNLAHQLFGQLRARRDLADVDRRTARLEAEFIEVVRRWGSSIESKDRYTQGHCERVADFACALAARVGMDERSLFWFRIGALLHDVGKLLIPAEVLNKPGRLDDEEWALVRRHPEAGVELLAGIDFPWDVRPIVLSHHERWDGRGYPHGLAGEGIPLVARILTVADVYDALTSERSYKPAMSHADALAVMRRDAGTQFDPALLAAFESVFPPDMAVPPSPRTLS